MEGVVAVPKAKGQEDLKRKEKRRQEKKEAKRKEKKEAKRKEKQKKKTTRHDSSSTLSTETSSSSSSGVNHKESKEEASVHLPLTVTLKHASCTNDTKEGKEHLSSSPLQPVVEVDSGEQNELRILQTKLKNLEQKRMEMETLKQVKLDRLRKRKEVAQQEQCVYSELLKQTPSTTTTTNTDTLQEQIQVLHNHIHKYKTNTLKKSLRKNKYYHQQIPIRKQEFQKLIRRRMHLLQIQEVQYHEFLVVYMNIMTLSVLIMVKNNAPPNPTVASNNNKNMSPPNVNDMDSHDPDVIMEMIRKLVASASYCNVTNECEIVEENDI